MTSGRQWRLKDWAPEVFCGAVEHTDYQVGRIVEAIEQTGELDNTLIFYLAGDNGPTPEGGLHGTTNKLSHFKKQLGSHSAKTDSERRPSRLITAAPEMRR